MRGGSRSDRLASAGESAYLDDVIVTKISQLQALMRAEKWADAIRFAAKFGDLGNARNAILSAKEAVVRPEFMRQLRKDPDALIAAGVEALRQRYPLRPQ